MATSEDPEARVRADAAIKLSLCALEMIHNVTVKLGGQADFAAAARGLLDNAAVDALNYEHFMREKLSREFAARMLVQLSNDIHDSGVINARPFREPSL